MMRVLTAADRNAVSNYLDDKYRTPFQLWQKYAFAGQDSAPTSDNDFDGLSNAMEYALGLNPLLSDSASIRLPQVEVIGDTVRVTYQRAADHPDVIAQLYGSPALITWTAVSETSLGVSGNVETRRHTSQVPAGTERLFYRLRAILP